VTEFCFETVNWAPYFGVMKPDVPRLVRAASAAGFRWISFDETILAAYCNSGESLASLRSLVESENLRTLSIHSAAIGADTQAAVEACQPLAEAAEMLGAPYIHVGGVAPVGEALIDATNAVARLARAAGAAVAIEFLPFLDIASIEHCRSLLRAADAEGSGIVVDTWHFFHGPDSWDELATLTANEIAYIQFDDSPALESDDLLFETTQRRVYPGDGIFELVPFAETIEATGFDGVVGLELLSAAHRELPVEEVARDLIAAAQRYWR
jgi:sugar phosphate isomerase/epimerase